MPLYEFECPKCGCRFEALVRMGGENSVACRSCGNTQIRKLASTFGIGGGGSRLKQSSAGCSTCSSNSCSTCR